MALDDFQLTGDVQAATIGSGIYLTLTSLLLKVFEMGNKASSVFRVWAVTRTSENNQQTQAKEVKSMWPFSAVLPKELNVGDTIIIEGKIADDAQIFSLNLVGEHDLSDKPHTVAYHHKIHFSESKTILNSKIGGQWQEEEIKGTQLEQGEEFTIEVKITEEGIYTYINSDNQGIFYHRIPIEEIKYLQIWDGIEKIQSMKVIFA